jgi:hypothetical protein
MLATSCKWQKIAKLYYMGMTYNTPHINHVLYNKTWFMKEEGNKLEKIKIPSEQNCPITPLQNAKRIANG